MLAGAFSCRHLNAHWSDEYIVPGASDGDVTDTACSGRILLVEQQVSLSLLIRDRNRQTSDFHVAPCTVAESLPCSIRPTRLSLNWARPSRPSSSVAICTTSSCVEKSKGA